MQKEREATRKHENRARDSDTQCDLKKKEGWHLWRPCQAQGPKDQDAGATKGQAGERDGQGKKGPTRAMDCANRKNV